MNYFGQDNYGGMHKYGYVPNGTWGPHQKPYPLSAKERDSWEVNQKGQKIAYKPQQEIYYKDHENQTEYVVEPVEPKHQMRDRMKDYDAQLKTQILIDNRYGNNAPGSMNIHHQPMLTRYHHHANNFGAGAYHAGTPYIPANAESKSQLGYEQEDEEEEA